MSLSAMLFGQDSAIHKVTNVLGLGIPGLLHKTFMPKDPKMAAIRLGELSQQSAKEGNPRPIPYGICRPIGGNLMYMSQPVKRMVKTYVGKSGGKGGSKKKKQYQDVEHVYRYYAIRVCEGPITGFRRIWRNGALVYDARKGSEWGAKNNHLFFKNYRLYTGTWNQMPDSMLQSRWGMDIPAHRGTAYLVADNEDLTDFGGAIPQWQFEVCRAEGVFLTSTLYPIEFDDDMSVAARAPSVKVLSAGSEDKMSVSMLAPVITRTTTVRYLDYHGEPEELTVSILAPTISRRTEVRYLTYDNAEPEELSVSILEPTVSRKTHPVYAMEPEELSVSILAPTIVRRTQ